MREKKDWTYILDSTPLASIDDLDLGGLAVVGQGGGEGDVCVTETNAANERDASGSCWNCERKKR